MPTKIYYLIWITLISILFKYWSKLKLSILNFTKYKINKSTKSWEKNKKVINIIKISTILLLIISLIIFSFFINKATDAPTWITVFLMCSVILTYTLTVIFNLLNIKQRKKDWDINKDISYNEFMKILKEEIHKEDEKEKEKLHKEIKTLKKKLKQ